MAITALPHATVHLLGSAQVLTTPTSLIKELIDNSLDAKSTSIDILISQNTLDKLEVRDNGHGITLEDLDSLGRRGHTSKLRCFEDLRLLGGTTLGFRGEALASAVRLGDVTLTTKTDGEAVATKVKLKPTGGVEHQSRASHPVGTTISVTNFMTKLPVRKKTFEKEAAKTLVNINQLLQAYALARPSIKFSLKVTKGTKGSWSYSPRLNGDIRGAVSQIIGRDTAMQCLEKSLTFPALPFGENEQNIVVDGSTSATDSSSLSQQERFTIDAFLPIAGADIPKLGHGQFISIDSRPVSSEKGTVKKIVTLFKKYLSSSLAETALKAKNPFIRLNIQCSLGSYDVNVEPAKDDILFGNEAIVLDTLENLLKDVYGTYKVDSPGSARRVMTKKLDDFEILLARKPTLAPSRNVIPQSDVLVEHDDHLVEPAPQASSMNGRECRSGQSRSPDIDDPVDGQAEIERRQWRFNMSTDYSEGVEGFQNMDQVNRHRKQVPSRQGDTDKPSSPKESLNPWVIAKMNAPIITNLEPHPQDLPQSTLGPSTPIAYSRPVSHSTASQRPRRTITSDSISQMESSAANISRGQEVLEPGSIPRRPVDNEDTMNVDREDALASVQNNQQSRITHGKDFCPARNMLEQFPMSPPATLASKNLRILHRPNKAFVSPLRPEQSSAESPQTPPSDAMPLSRTPTSAVDRDSGMAGSELNLAWAMDFEERKAAATRQRREELKLKRSKVGPSGGIEAPRSSPHKNRYNSAVATLEEDILQPELGISGKPLGPPFKTSLSEEDARAYLMRRQKSMTAQPNKPGDLPRQMRSKSRKLPMERIPKDGQLYDLIQILPTDIQSVLNAIKALQNHELYISSGNSTGGLSEVSEDTNTMLRLEEIAKAWLRKAEEI